MRNLKRTKEKIEEYLGSKIVAWVWEYEEYVLNEKTQVGKWVEKKEVVCHLYRVGSKWQPLNLGECNDGSKFTAVNQAINQAKEFIDICNKNNW